VSVWRVAALTTAALLAILCILHLTT